MHDAFGRRINYVRLSVTDRCNLRCTYCMAEDMQFMPRRDLLTFDEIERLALHLVGRGVKRIRLTGGEPLVRKGIVEKFQLNVRNLIIHCNQLASVDREPTHRLHGLPS